MRLINLCERPEVLALGKVLQDKGVIAYRGSITNIPHGLRWTTDIEEAKWVLNRWEDKDLGGGTVYAAHIMSSDILIYVVDEKRQELLIKPEQVEYISVNFITSV